MALPTRIGMPFYTLLLFEGVKSIMPLTNTTAARLVRFKNAPLIGWLLFLQRNTI
ncbi:MAG: hypothetical protein SNJ59_05270 [Aggregatilineales bacterium]